MTMAPVQKNDDGSDCPAARRPDGGAAYHTASTGPWQAASVGGRAYRAICLAVIVLGLTAKAVAGDMAPTPRGQEILAKFRQWRPPGADDGGTWLLEHWPAAAGLEALVEIPDNSADAAECFRRLEDLFPEELAVLDGAGAGGAAGVDALLDAAARGECRFAEVYPPFEAADSPQPDFQILRLYLRALLLRAGEREAAGDRPDAERSYQAALLCGRHLTAARPSSVVYVTGLIYCLRGAQAYGGFLARNGEGDRAAAVRRFAERTEILYRAFLWKANVALGEFDGFACLPTVILVAREDREPFWRKDAVIRLATLRYGVPTGDDAVQRQPEFEAMADAALLHAANADPDPGVRRMALWAARTIRPDRYAAMEHRFLPPPDGN
ncbi:MAG: hypothetical protein LIP77_11350 [Planctomycetes bacterium]|nr:hypothetical protein [Planctomycetota bacterium]